MAVVYFVFMQLSTVLGFYLQAILPRVFYLFSYNLAKILLLLKYWEFPKLLNTKTTQEPIYKMILYNTVSDTTRFKKEPINGHFTMYLFVCVEVLRPSQPSGVMSSAVSLLNHTFTGQA